MATHQITRSIALRTGLPLDYVQDVAYSLQRADAWISLSQAVANIVVAVAVGAEPRHAASIAKHYAALADDEGNLAGDFLEGIIQTFLAQARIPFSALAYRSQIEVYSGTPAIRVQTPCNDGETLETTYLETHDANAWHSSTMRRSTIISGKALFDICADLNIAAAVAA